MSVQNSSALRDRIEALKRERNAVILAHYYTTPEVQAVADFLGDSLALSVEAQQVEAEVILFAGVHFMAETAKVLCPDKRVLIPCPEAGCSLADSCPAEAFAAFKARYPGYRVVSYVNTSVGVKALRDYEVGSGTVTPYIGARYLRLTTDQYTSSLGIHYDSETQNLFLLPVGVDYSADIDHGSWKLRPYIGAGYIWTMGDRNGDQTISYGNAADTIAFDTADSGSFLAKAGITADWNTFSFGIGYAYQKSDNVKNNVWMANASFKF